jgi:hypothetical protein
MVFKSRHLHRKVELPMQWTAKYAFAAIAYGTSLVPKNSFSTCKLRHCLTALPEVAALWSQAFLTFFDSFCCYKIHFVSGSS